jgi:hypothetical protein
MRRVGGPTRPSGLAGSGAVRAIIGVSARA